MTLAIAAAQAYEALDAAAREAKRTEAASRRRARDIRQAMSRLREACDELGIQIDTDSRGHSHVGRDPRS